jgi:uncharacterized membrane protein
MLDRLRFYFNRLQERLWVRPLLFCILSVAAAFLARATDGWGIAHLVPDLTSESVTTLLRVMSSSMLVIATFAVGSMVSAYSSASNTATPRSFPVIVADDVSQNALSAFIGSFIFSIVGLVAMENGYYDITGRFTLFVFTVLAFAIVVITFVRWVDKIARLGRMGNTVDKVEAAAAQSLQRRRRAPNLCAHAGFEDLGETRSVEGLEVGYLQRVDLPELQEAAVALDCRIQVVATPGSYISPGKVLAEIECDESKLEDKALASIRAAFVIGHDRTFDDDPRFGLITLSEIASRALSPAVNDPGTAIDVIGTLLRLLVHWCQPVPEEEQRELLYDRLAVNSLCTEDIFTDAFGSIARDGAGTVEVMVRLLKALNSLCHCEDEDIGKQARAMAREVLGRAEQAMEFDQDIEAVREAAAFAAEDQFRVNQTRAG